MSWVDGSSLFLLWCSYNDLSTWILHTCFVPCLVYHSTCVLMSEVFFAACVFLYSCLSVKRKCFENGRFLLLSEVDLVVFCSWQKRDFPAFVIDTQRVRERKREQKIMPLEMILSQTLLVFIVHWLHTHTTLCSGSGARANCVSLKLFLFLQKKSSQRGRDVGRR